MLLPQANRDTLQQLLCFLDQVAMYSSEIILIDGTESMGNRMTEENLALIFGPNILHKVKCFCCSGRLLVGQVLPHSHIGKTLKIQKSYFASEIMLLILISLHNDVVIICKW